MRDAPPQVRKWAESQLGILEPLIDRCIAAELLQKDDPEIARSDD
jgi:hypothetical protein